MSPNIMSLFFLPTDFPLKISFLSVLHIVWKSWRNNQNMWYDNKLNQLMCSHNVSNGFLRSILGSQIPHTILFRFNIHPLIMLWLTAVIVFVKLIHTLHIMDICSYFKHLFFYVIPHFICHPRSKWGASTVAADSGWTTHGARCHAGWHRGPHQVMTHLMTLLKSFIYRIRGERVDIL